MITYKCPGCGGQLELGNGGSFICPFCGTKSYMSDSDFEGNRKFRELLLSYAKAAGTARENDYGTDTLFEKAGEAEYLSRDGVEVVIEYMFRYRRSRYECFIARESVIYVFDEDADADMFLSGLSRLQFPEADTKLKRSFPEYKMTLALEKGTAVLFYRRPDFYPAEFFKPLASGNLAWVISRMENICCALEYSEITHGGIDPSSLFINPKTHEGALFGDWGNVSGKKDAGDLKDLRDTASYLAEDPEKPEEMGKFLKSEPCESAYDDFSKWDEVIEKGFGGHHFRQFQ